MVVNNAINLKDAGIPSHDGAGVFVGRTLTGTADFIDVADGDGILGVPIFDVADNFEETGMHSWNGAIIESAAVTVTSDGATITCSVEKTGGGDLTAVFSDGYYAWVTAPDTVALTPGSDTSPQINYVYLLQSDKTLTASTAGFPATEHVPITTALCQSAASLATEGSYKVHVWTDHIKDPSEQGHVSDINSWIRQQNATWKSGVSQTYSIAGGPPNNVIFTTSSGSVLQLHDHTFPAFAGTPDLYVVNDSVTPYTIVDDLNEITADSTGATLDNKYYSLVIWGCVSEAEADCKLFVNLPGGSYNTSAGVDSDASNYANYSFPSDFVGTAFLISEWKLRKQAVGGGTFTSISEIDLRGLVPSIAAGGVVDGVNEFVDNVFRVVDEGDGTKEIAFQADQITTATTRTITMLDADIDLANVVQASAALTDFAVMCGDGGVRGSQTLAALGDAGQVLTSNGAAALPTFQSFGNAYEFISKTTVSSPAATIDFESEISGVYDSYAINFYNVILVTDARRLGMRVGTGGTPTYITSSTYSQSTNTYNGPAIAFQISEDDMGSGAGEYGCSGWVYLYNVNSTSVTKQSTITTIGVNSTVLSDQNLGGCVFEDSTAAITAFQFFSLLDQDNLDGNVESGVFIVYGLTDS